jgi:toxin-antitoxin system PIN domain toxin
VPIELPDVNVLLALTDPVHAHHEVASQWFAAFSGLGWATCPLTENGFVRILSNPAYPGVRVSPADAIFLLETLLQNHAAMHHFWPDSVSLRDRTLFRPEAIAGHRQINDVYLLGRCQQNGGTLVTLDAAITDAAIVSPHADLIRRL